MTRQGSRVIIATGFDNIYFPVAVPSHADNNKIIEYIDNIVGKRRAAIPDQDFLKIFEPLPAPSNSLYVWKEINLRNIAKNWKQVILDVCHRCYDGTKKTYIKKRRYKLRERYTNSNTLC